MSIENKVARLLRRNSDQWRVIDGARNNKIAYNASLGVSCNEIPLIVL